MLPVELSLVGTNEVSHRMWSPCEAAKSSAWRELKAIHFALTSFKTLVQGKSVKWHSDNQGAVHIVDVGSPHPELHSIALDILDFCRTNNVILVPQWVPRELNVSADEISKIVDYDDWYTTLEFLRTWIVSGARILLIGLRMHPMLISQGLILGFAYRVPKPLMYFQSHGQERTIGWFLQYIALLGWSNTLFALLLVL